MRVLFVASECFPLIKTGGLADVVGALPLALSHQKVDTTVFLPGFPAVLKGLKKKSSSKIFKIGKLKAIHNLAFQGLFPKELMKGIDLPESYYSREGMEYWNKISFLKAGIVYSDHVTTVSPTYALEIQTDNGGMGFGGLLRSRGDSLSGIVNGIDTQIWNPETDPDIPSAYSSNDIRGKAACKRTLQKTMGLPQRSEAPLFAVVSRLTTQKGLDALSRAD